MKLSELIPEALFSSQYDPSLEVNGIASHTDDVKQGDLFICKKGRRFDPSCLLSLVEKKGAVAVIAEQSLTLPPSHIPCFRVHDAREAEAVGLYHLYHLDKGMPKLIGITGTNGKTSTAWMVHHVLKENGVCCGYIGTLGTFLNGNRLSAFCADGITTPPPSLLFSVLGHFRDVGAEAVVMEVSSHALSQKRVHGLSFAFGVFTNLTEDHLDYHHTWEDYFEAKRALFEQTKHAVINVDDPYGKQLYSLLSIPKSSCGVIEDASYFIEDLYETPAEGTKYRCVTPYMPFPVSYPLSGSFNVYNTLLAITVSLLYGLCPDQIQKALSCLPAIPGRFERLPIDAPFTVIIDYAHTPDAMEQALKAARRLTKGDLYALFGAGGEREKEKRSVMGRIAETLADFCIVTTDNPRGERPCAIFADILSGMQRSEKRLVISDRRRAIITALLRLKAGDTLLLLGKGHEEYIITREGKKHFSEREIVTSFMERIQHNDH